MNNLKSCLSKGFNTINMSETEKKRVIVRLCKYCDQIHLTDQIGGNGHS